MGGELPSMTQEFCAGVLAVPAPASGADDIGEEKNRSLLARGLDDDAGEGAAARGGTISWQMALARADRAKADPVQDCQERLDKWIDIMRKGWSRWSPACGHGMSCEGE